MKAPTTDQIRARIDRGQTGEKVDMPDPATVPLGTDAEAGGVSPTAQERQLEAQTAAKTARPQREKPSGIVVYVVLAVAAVAVFIAVALAALS